MKYFFKQLETINFGKKLANGKHIKLNRRKLPQNHL
jgi:hypothetical protein